MRSLRNWLHISRKSETWRHESARDKMGGSERRGRARCCSRLYRIWPPQAWCRQRCAKNDEFSALLTARSYFVRAREQCQVNVVLRRDIELTRRRDRITMALVTVQRSPSVSSSPQSSVSVLLPSTYNSSCTHRIIGALSAASKVRLQCRPVESLARATPFRPELRPAVLPYLAPW